MNKLIKMKQVAIVVFPNCYDVYIYSLKLVHIAIDKQLSQCFYAIKTISYITYIINVPHVRHDI